MGVRIKKIHPTFWVSYIDLRNLRNLDKNVDSLEDVQKLFEKIFNFETTNEFQKAIFNDSFMAGKTILLWIGLEDIFPDYGKETLNIFKIIQTETRNIQFISTRPSYSGELMQKLRTKSYTFTPFSTKEQEKFLRKFFISQNLNNETQIATYLEKVHKIVKSENLKDGSMTPLLLRMIAELISNDKELFETENLYENYEKFIDTKIKEWLKTEFGKNNSNLKDFSFKKFYQQCAIKIIPESFALSFNSKHLQIMKLKTSKDLNVEISRMEILYINGPKSIKFTHDSFANFFFAQYLIENIYNLNIHDNVSIQELDYRLRVFCGISEYPEVTNFIASYLQSKAAKSAVKFHPKLSYLFKTKFKRVFFNYLKLEFIHFDIFSFLINFFQNDHELLIDLLQINQSKTYYTELFNYGNLAFLAFFNYDMDLNKIKNTAKTHLNDLEFEKFLIGNNQKGIIQFSSYCFYKRQDGDSDDDLRFLLINQKYKLGKKLLKSKKPDYVFNTIANNLTKEELKELLTSKALLYPIQLRDDDVYIFDEKMWKRIEENLSIEEQKRWLNDMIQLVAFSQNRNLTEKFFLKIDQIFSNLEIIKLFQDRQILQISASYNINIFNYLWNFYVNHSTKIDQIFILKQQVEVECTGDFNPYGDCYLFPSLNILLSSLLDLDFFDIEDVRNIYIAYFNTTEIQNMILSSDNFLTYSFNHHTFEACKSLLFVLKSFFKSNQNLLKDFYTYTRDLLPVLPNYEYYEDKYELLSQAIDDLTY